MTIGQVLMRAMKTSSHQRSWDNGEHCQSLRVGYGRLQ